MVWKGKCWNFQVQTSAGARNIDFSFFCRAIVHWFWGDPDDFLAVGVCDDLINGVHCSIGVNTWNFKCKQRLIENYWFFHFSCGIIHGFLVIWLYFYQTFLWVSITTNVMTYDYSYHIWKCTFCGAFIIITGGYSFHLFYF